jgi:16S rRNA (uracil1498-N3)-methyltransferase
LSVPVINDAVSLDQLLVDWPTERPLLVADESGVGIPITNVAEAFRGDDGNTSSGQGLLIGPEGGFTGAERDQLSRLEFVTMIDPGPRILRAETAAVSALACWQALIGGWYGISHA